LRKTECKAYKFRLYPTKAQERKLEYTLGLCCELYNAAVDERRSAYRMCGVSINYYDQANQLPAIKQVRPDLSEVFSQVLQDVLRRVDKAFKGFFSRVKQGIKAGYPRFLRKGRYASFTFPQGGWSIKNDKLTLSKIDILKVKLHREVIGQVKICTIKREGHKWFVVFSVEYEFDCPETHAGPSVGIDVGLEYFASLSDETQIENPRYYRKAEKHLAKCQRKAAKVRNLPKNDPRKIKAKYALTKAYNKAANQRKDFLHKLSTKIAKFYRVVCVENIKPANLFRRPKPKPDEATGQFLPNNAATKSGLNKSIADAGWSTFIAMLDYKVAYTGSQLVKVSPAYTSQICPNPECGRIKPKDLSERWHICECGVRMPRDIASAKVILRIGLDSLGSQSVNAPSARPGE
jgi:putative transposase